VPIVSPRVPPETGIALPAGSGQGPQWAETDDDATRDNIRNGSHCRLSRQLSQLIRLIRFVAVYCQFSCHPFFQDIDRLRAVHEPVASRHSPHVLGFVHLHLARPVLQPSLRIPRCSRFPTKHHSRPRPLPQHQHSVSPRRRKYRVEIPSWFGASTLGNYRILGVYSAVLHPTSCDAATDVTAPTLDANRHPTTS
jgi:hypothetical protein